MQRKSLEFIRKTKAYRISEILRKLYGGKNISVKGMCNHFFGKDANENDIKSIQRDFKFLLEETNIPIEPYYEKDQEASSTHYMIQHDHIKTGQKKVGELEIFASLIQDKYTRIFKNTGFQEVLDNTYSIIQDFYSSDLEDKFQLQDELLDFFYNIETGMFNYSNWEKDIGGIINAILNQKYIQYQYQSQNATEAKTHKVFPAKMIYTSGTLYLYVYDLKKERNRDYFMIAIHRIVPETVEVHDILEIKEDIEEIIKSNPETENMSLKRFITDKVCDINIDEKRIFSYGLVWKEENVQNVKLEFKKWAADHVRNRDWHFEPVMEELENGNLIMKMKLDINRELITWIMSRLPEVIIHEPQGLIDKVQERLETFQEDHKL